jgi:hypothetical protein
MQRIDYRMATTNCWRTVKRLDSGETADDFSRAHNQRTSDSEYAVNRAINSNMETSVRMVYGHPRQALLMSSRGNQANRDQLMEISPMIGVYS